MISMENISSKLTLLLGKPIEINEIGDVYAPTLNEIESIGLDLYYYYLSLITVKLEQFEQYEQVYDELIKYRENQQFFINILSFFTKDEFAFSYELQSFVSIKYRKISRDNFTIFVNAIKLINYIKIEKETKYFNNRAKQMAEKFKKLREKYEKVLKKDDGSLDYTDIVSTVASRHSSINLLNIGELTIYQLVDKFKRLTNIDEYQTNIQALMNGAKDIQLKHYSSKID